MNAILEALEKLDAEAHLIQRNAARPRFNPETDCSRLGQVLETLRASHDEIRLERTKLDPREVWEQFRASRYDLSRLDSLQFRTLCCAEETALRPELISALTQDTNRLKNNRCLHGFVTRYFAEWRTMDEPEQVETLLNSLFSSYRSTNPAVVKWAANRPLFSEQAAITLAGKVCAEQTTVNRVLKSNYIELTTGLASCTRSLAASSAVDRFIREQNIQDEEWRLRYLQWTTGQILSDAPLDALRPSISRLILSSSAQDSVPIQGALRDYIQHHKHLGDPRMPGTEANWRSIQPEAAQRYRSWLARDSIIYFFNTILPNNNENRRRKDFWLQYHDRITDFQLAVSDEDLWKLKSRNDPEALCYSRVNHATTSAFLMTFEGYGGHYLIVEFSETGNAAYVYNLADFTSTHLSLRTPRFELKRDLKFDDSHRILHPKAPLGAWERRAAAKLSSEFGIRP